MNDLAANQPQPPRGNPPHLRAWCIARWVMVILAGTLTAYAVAILCSMISDPQEVAEGRHNGLVVAVSQSIGKSEHVVHSELFADLVADCEIDLPSWTQINECEVAGFFSLTESASGWPMRSLNGATISWRDSIRKQLCHRTLSEIDSSMPDVFCDLGFPRKSINIPKSVIWSGMVVNSIFWSMILAAPMVMARTGGRFVWARRRKLRCCQHCKHLQPPEKYTKCMECGFPHVIVRRSAGKRWVGIYGVVIVTIGMSFVYIVDEIDKGIYRTPEVIAIAEGDIDTLRQLVNDGLDVDKVNRASDDDLMTIAVKYQRLAAFELLVENGAVPKNQQKLSYLLSLTLDDLNFIRDRGDAVRLQFVKSLLKLGADPLYPTPEFGRPLVASISSVSFECFAAMIKASSPLCELPVDELDDLIMKQSIRTNDQDIQRYFEGEAIGELPALTCVTDADRMDMFERLMFTTLPQRVWTSANERTLRLIEQGYATRVESKRLAEMFKGLSASPSFMAKAIAKGFDPFARTEDGSNWWFHVAHANGGEYEMYFVIQQWEYLLYLGVDPTQPRNDGTTPIEAATCKHLRNFLRDYINDQQHHSR